MATSARFQLKRDTKINWDASTVKLQSGEPGWDITNKVLKIGDGNRLWNELSAVSGGGGGPSLNPLTLSISSTNPFPNDFTINLRSTWDVNTPQILNRTLVINDITNSGSSEEIYRNENVNFPLSESGEYTIVLQSPTFFVFGHTYRVVAYNDPTTELASVNVTYNSPNLNFTLGIPYIISPKAIGLPYTYTDSPRIEGVRIRVYTTTLDSAIVDLQDQIIPRNYTANTPTPFRLNYSTGYSTTTYNIRIDYGGGTNSSTTLVYTVPAISTYVFRAANNQFIDITMNNSALVTLTVTKTGETVNGQTLVDASTTQGIQLATYPAYTNSYAITARFDDNETVAAATPLVYNTYGNIANVAFPPVSSGSDPISCTATLSFRNITSSTWNTAGGGNSIGDPRPSVNLRIQKQDGTDSTTHLINSESVGWTSSGSGVSTLYSFTGSIMKNFTYGETYQAVLLNADNTILSTKTPLTITGNFVPANSITSKTPGIAGNSATVSGLAWTGIGYSALVANIYEYISGANPNYITPLGVGAYNTTLGNVTISLNTGTSFNIGTQYVVAIVGPDGNEYISLPSAAYSATNIVKKSISKTSVIVTVTWLEDNATFRIFNFIDNVVGTQVNTNYSITRPVGVTPLTGTSDVTVTLNSPLTEFVYGNYYVVEVTFTTTSNSSYATPSFQYVFTSFTITDASPSFPASPPNGLTFGFTPTGISGETRLNLTVYTITDANSQGSVGIIEVPNNGWIGSDYNPSVFETKQLVFAGNTLQPVTLLNSFVRNDFYFIELKCPDQNGTSLAFSTNARVYNPSSISLTLEPNTAFVTNATNGRTACTLSILGPTANATYYLRLFRNVNGVITGLSTDNTWGNSTKINGAFPTTVTSLSSSTSTTFVTYNFPIEKGTSAIKTPYYLNSALDVGDDSIVADLAARYPSAASPPSYFYYTYDSTIYTARPITVSFTNDNTKASFVIPWKGYPAKGWLYLTTTSNGIGVNRRFTSITLPNSPNATTDVLVTDAAVYSNVNPGAGVEPTSPLVLNFVTYYPGLWLNTADSTEFIVGTVLAYSPTSVSVSVGTVTATTVELTFTWGGAIDPGTTPFAFTITPSGGAAVHSSSITKTAGSTSSTRTVNYSWTTGTTYTVSVTQVGGRAPATDTFTYIATTLITASRTFVFEDSTASSPYQLGRLNVGGSIASGYSSVYVVLTLQEYTTTSSAATTNTPSIAFTLNITNNAGTAFSSKIWTQDNFTIGYYYNVLCSVFTAASGGTQLVTPTFMISPRQQYNPAGYDILVFIGQSNMCGRDNGGTLTPSPNSRETNANPPLYTSQENATALVSDNTKNVHIVNDPNGNIITTTTAVQFDSFADSRTAGVTQAYEFTKLYANSVKSPSTRTVGVVFVPVGGTGFITGTAGWADGGGLYNNAVNATNKYRTQRLVSGTNYSSNRVVAIVLHQGESDHGQQTWNTVVNTAITSFITDTAPMSHIKYTKFLCGNLDLLTSASAIDRSTLASGVSATEQTALRKAFVVPNQIDDFPTLRTGTYAAASYSSLGVVSIDADPDQPDDPEVVANSGCYNASSGGIHLSARAERLLGLRAFNAYARLIVGDTATTSSIYPSIAIDPVSALPPELSVFNAQTNILSFNSTANSSAYSANPLCYLISYVPSTGTVVRIVATEYNSMQSTATTTSNTRYCSIPYFTYSSGTRSSYGSGASFTLPITGVASGYPVNIYPAIYSFPSGEAYVVNGVKNSAMVDSTATSAVTPKPLNLDMTQFINSFTPTSNANVGSFTTLKFSLQIQAVYATGGVPSPFTGQRPMSLSQAYYLPPIIGTKMLNLQATLSNASDNATVLGSSVIGSSWIVTPTLPGVGSGGSPILSTNRATGGTNGGYLVFAGCPYNTSLSAGSWIGPTPSSRAEINMSTSANTGVIGASTTSLRVTLSATPSPAIGVGSTVTITFSGTGTLPGGALQTTLNGTYTTITGTTGTIVIVTLPAGARTVGTFTPGTSSKVNGTNMSTSSNTGVITALSTSLTVTLSTSPSPAIGVGNIVNIVFAGSATLPGGNQQNVLNEQYTTIAGTTGTTVVVDIPLRQTGTFTPGSGSKVDVNAAVQGITQTGAAQGGVSTYLVVGTATTGLEGFGTYAFGTNFTKAWSYTGDEGMTYTRVINGIDWVLFFSASKYATSGNSGFPGRSGFPSSRVDSTMFCGIAAETTGGTPCPLNPAGQALTDILGIPNPMYYYMYNTGCGFITALRNVISTNIYTVRYYISTRSGRVPHNDTTDTGKVTFASTEHDLYLSNPFPIRVFTKPPQNSSSAINIIDTNAVIGQDVHFGAGTEATTTSTTRYLTTSYLHPSAQSPWDGSWKRMVFRFQLSRLTPITGTIASDGSYTFNHVYIQFGPLPTVHRVGAPAANGPDEFVNTCINIAGIMISIDNAGLIT